MTITKTALVVGATGGIGSEVSLALLRRGWQIRALSRNAAPAAAKHPDLSGVVWIAGDALRRDDVLAATAGASIIVHAANPPAYRNWTSEVLPMLDSTIAAAAANGARVVLPGTIYNFGPDAFPVLTEASPQNPSTRKGKIRVEMEHRLAAATGRGARTLIVRAGDFYGPRSGNSWFSGGMVQPGKPVRSVWHPGTPGVGHAWAYLPDVAETMAQLLDAEASLGDFEVFHFRGHWMDDAIEMPRAIARVVGNPSVRVRPLPWWAVAAASPFVNLARELLEMRYLWREPLMLDNAKLVAFLGMEPHTPLDDAVTTTLAGMGCLERARPAVAGAAIVSRT